jgi:hypothetical protein
MVSISKLPCIHMHPTAVRPLKSGEQLFCGPSGFSLTDMCVQRGATQLQIGPLLLSYSMEWIVAFERGKKICFLVSINPALASGRPAREFAWDRFPYFAPLDI